MAKFARFRVPHSFGGFLLHATGDHTCFFAVWDQLPRQTDRYPGVFMGMSVFGDQGRHSGLGFGVFGIGGPTR